MSGSRPVRLPEDLRTEILAFLRGLSSPELVEEDGRVTRLALSPDAHLGPAASPLTGPPGAGATAQVLARHDLPPRDAPAAAWRLEVTYGKLLLEAWGGGRSVVRRIEAVERDGHRMLLKAGKPGGAAGVELEIREAGEAESGAAGFAARDAHDETSELETPREQRTRERTGFERELLALFEREFPGLHLEKVTHRPDRERCFSGCYTRGCARRGREAWAFLGLGEHEGPSATEGALVYGLIWLDWVRERLASARQPAVVTGLKMFLPAQAVAVAAHRAAYLDRRTAGIEIYEWQPGYARPIPVDLRDYGNVETRLTPRWRGARLVEQLRPVVRGLLRGLPSGLAGRVSVLPDALGDALSLRVFGLAVARIEGGEPPKVSFGLEGERRELVTERLTEFREFLESVLRLRRPRGPSRSHPFYRLQPERWLESLLVEDITRLDATFLPGHVYPQVPAFTGPATPSLSRGVIDILGVTRDPASGAHRLAVVELKLDEDPNLPMQGLDYWLRVKWLEERDQFREYGYFAGLTPSPLPPVLYLVSPAFRFHSTTERILRYFQQSIRVVKVGLNQRWREGVKVLFRRTMEQGRAVDDRPMEEALPLQQAEVAVPTRAGRPGRRLR